MEWKSNMKYISDGTWFIEGTEAVFKEELTPWSGIFEGWIIIKDEEFKKIKDIQTWRDARVGDRIWDREHCHYDEFQKIEE